MEQRSGGMRGRRQERGPLLAEISRRVVQLHKDSYGRGPTMARTSWDNDVITVVLRGALTRDERTLRDAGRGDAVIGYRMQFQEAVRGRFKGEIERLTGRPVIGFISGVQVEDPEMAVEVFVLEPVDGGSPDVESDDEIEHVSAVAPRP